MENLVFLFLVFLPICQSSMSCPEEDIEEGKSTRDFSLTGSETKIYFSKKGTNEFGFITFIVKCSKSDKEISMLVIQRKRTLDSFRLNGKDVKLADFYMTNPAEMRLTHSEKILSTSILDTRGQWRDLVKDNSLLPEKGNCTLHVESRDHYAVWLPCQTSAQARANLWYLLLLPVFVILFVVLYLKRKKLLKFCQEGGFSPADTHHVDEGTMRYNARRDFGSPEAEPIKTRYGLSDQRDGSQCDPTNGLPHQPEISPCKDSGEYTANNTYGLPYLQECSPYEENGQYTTNNTYGLPDQKEISSGGERVQY